MKKLQTTLDKITTLISAILCAAMMVILFANVVLRLIPGIGGFKWYMESSQYLNVWSMLIACIGINAMGTNLRVEVVDSILGKTPLGKKIVVIIRDVFIILFYVMVTYGGYQLCTRAKQAVSTMPQFTMVRCTPSSPLPVCCASCPPFSIWWLSLPRNLKEANPNDRMAADLILRSAVSGRAHRHESGPVRHGRHPVPRRRQHRHHCPAHV